MIANIFRIIAIILFIAAIALPNQDFIAGGLISLTLSFINFKQG